MHHYSDVAFRRQYPLSPKKIIKKVLWGNFMYCITFVELFLVRLILKGVRELQDIVALSHEILLVVGVFIFLQIINYFYQADYIKRYYYTLTDNLLIIRKGVFMPKEITVPIERIQDLYIDQDFFDRLLGIYDVHISTATAESTVRAHIDGVSKKVAEELRELILNKAQQATNKTGL